MDSQPGSQCGVHNEDRAHSFQITRDQYVADRNSKVRGTANPSIMDKPFWKYMIVRGDSAYRARKLFDGQENEQDVYRDEEYEDIDSLDWPLCPVWCFDRFGRTVTVLPDGRHVYIGGEHEDSYDPDFAIYNDVVVINRSRTSFTAEENVDDSDFDCRSTRDSTYYDMALQLSEPNDITIYGYPLDIFPPTDFHTATHFHDPASGRESIYIIGGLGYQHSALRDRTDVYRLDISNFSFQRLETTGMGPSGGIYRHKAELVDSEDGTEPTIRVTTKEGKGFSLLIKKLEWISHV